MIKTARNRHGHIAKYKLMVEQEIAKLDGHEIIDGKLKLAFCDL